MQRRNQGKTENLNIPITTIGIEAIINYQQTTLLDRMLSLVNFAKHSKKKELIPMLLKL